MYTGKQKKKIGKYMYECMMTYRVGHSELDCCWFAACELGAIHAHPKTQSKLQIPAAAFYHRHGTRCRGYYHLIWWTHHFEYYSTDQSKVLYNQLHLALSLCLDYLNNWQIEAVYILKLVKAFTFYSKNHVILFSKYVYVHVCIHVHVCLN